MNKQNIEMIDVLRKFVIETVKNTDKATPAQLEAMARVADVVVRFGDY